MILKSQSAVNCLCSADAEHGSLTANISCRTPNLLKQLFTKVDRLVAVLVVHHYTLIIILHNLVDVFANTRPKKHVLRQHLHFSRPWCSTYILSLMFVFISGVIRTRSPFNIRPWYIVNSVWCLKKSLTFIWHCLILSVLLNVMSFF